MFVICGRHWTLLEGIGGQGDTTIESGRHEARVFDGPADEGGEGI